jgi:thiamine-phosphate pyrophosphorylase
MAQRTELYLRLEGSALPAPSELEAVIAAARPAALLIGAFSGAAAADAARELIASAKRRNLSVLIEGGPELAQSLGADGIHMSADQARVTQARRVLGEDKTIGASCSLSRHEAMVMAESGADYVAFGEPRGAAPVDAEALEEMAAWWASLFEVPCVVWLGEDPVGEASALIDAGVDFLGLSWRAGDGEPGLERLARVADVLGKR